MSKADLLYEFIWLSRPLMQQAEALVEQTLGGTGLTVRMRAVLEILAREGSLPVPALAAKLEIARQYVQVMVNETHSAGLTTRRPNPRHKRSDLIVLTEKGAALIHETMQRERDALTQMAERLQLADIDTALSVAQHCHSAMRQMNRQG